MRENSPAFSGIRLSWRRPAQPSLPRIFPVAEQTGSPVPFRLNPSWRRPTSPSGPDL